MYCILKLLDNTFIGTLLAGSILAWFGFYLYRKQKEVDIEYEELRKIRELASSLFANIEMTSGKYRGQLNVRDGKNSILERVFNLMNKKFDNHFSEVAAKEFNDLSIIITKATDNLIAQLKISSGYDKEIGFLTEKIPSLNMCFLGISALHLYSPKDINDLRAFFEELQKPIQDMLQDIIKGKK